MSAALRPGSEGLLRHFAIPPGRTYVDSASYGLPPAATSEAVTEALEAWRHGDADWRSDWDPAGDECRSLIAQMLDVPSEQVALLPAASSGFAALAASLSPLDEVLVPEDEFNSLLLPFVVAE